MRDDSLKYKKFSRRALFLGGIKLFFFSVIAGRYYYLQMVSSSKFTTLSDKNRMKLMVLTAPRGIIYDCDYEVIATNSSNFRVGIDSLAIPNVSDLITQISSVLGMDLTLGEEDIRRRIAKRQPNDYLYIKDNLSWTDISKLIESDHMLPGVEVVESSHRSYRFADAFAHITGYVSSPNKQEVESLSMPISDQMKIGKMGVEKIFDNTLMGYPGLKKTEVDSRGKFIRVISKENPAPGRDIVLSVNSKLQNFIHELLTTRDLTASVVVMNVQNGHILALHSTPSFDPNLFVDGISKNDWDNIMKADSNPLLNHAITSAYPPGSTFKLVTAFSGLIAGLDPKTRYFCPGEFRLGSRVFRCWKPSGHGLIDLPTAIMQSCNPYFFNLALKMGMNKLYSGAKALGLGERTGIELLGEVDGLMPSPEWKKSRYKLDWYPGDTVNASIGQGYTLLTPLQIATMTARIASGKKVSPTLVPTEKEIEPLDADPKILQVIKGGMFDCVNSPGGILYSRSLSIGDLTICGKTGTAQVVALKYKHLGHKYKHHGLFTSFAPYNDPKYAVTVVVEHGEAGAKVSPLAKEIYEFMLINGIS
ncbi:MAG: peptidoglycan glycosyltransferase [Candidatus Midichloriaceae bacterium]|jgi:penicillin-binding protein 2|nr:peptidoglycan glycosyltransferase [Candidatus Midichloriaceae bacterium]